MDQMDRIYNLKLSNNQPFVQIGSDGGFLQYPVTLTELLLGPGERADILIDFTKLIPNTKIIMINNANAPFPNGDPPDPRTVGQIMQFTILDTPVITPIKIPCILNNIPVLTPDAPRRILTLYVVQGADGPLELLLDGQKWDSPISESPIVGSTEEWEIVNLTNGAHPIHVHLIQFKDANRQKINNVKYQQEWVKLNGEPPLRHPTIPLPVEAFIEGNIIAPAKNERGWKDTVLMPPGHVTRLKLRFAPQKVNPRIVKPGINTFPFDPSYGPGYVWHCHILEHEDNEMMRPLIVRSNTKPIF